MAKYIILGDMHGCKEYKDSISGLVEKVDGVLATGDIGGYGPDSLECYLWMMDLQKRFRSKGKICKIVRGNHEEDVILKLNHPGVPLTMKGASEAAERGHLWMIKQLFGDEVCYHSKGELVVDEKKLKNILIVNWDAELKSGNKNIVNPSYFRKNAERASMIQEVLFFIAKLPEEEKVGRVKIMHTYKVKEGRSRVPRYVVDESQLEYFNRVMQKLGRRLEENRFVMYDQVFDSGVFSDCDVLMLGHVHTSDTYFRDGKRIVMANSPYPRDGKGTRAPVLTYDGGLVSRKDLQYDYEETERKLSESNPMFLKQIELYRSVQRQ